MIKIIKSYWNGNQKLWKVFWIFNFLWPFLFSILLTFVLLAFMYPAILFLMGINEASGNVTHSYSISDLLLTLMGIVFIGILAAYSVWALVSLWRSAFNVSKRIYGYLARLWVAFQIFYFVIFPLFYFLG